MLPMIAEPNQRIPATQICQPLKATLKSFHQMPANPETADKSPESEHPLRHRVALSGSRSGSVSD